MCREEGMGGWLELMHRQLERQQCVLLTVWSKMNKFIFLVFFFHKITSCNHLTQKQHLHERTTEQYWRIIKNLIRAVRVVRNRHGRKNGLMWRAHALTIITYCVCPPTTCNHGYTNSLYVHAARWLCSLFQECAPNISLKNNNTDRRGCKDAVYRTWYTITGDHS